MTPENDPFELHARRYEHQRKRLEALMRFREQQDGVSEMKDNMFEILAEKGFNLRPITREEIYGLDSNRGNPTQVNYVHSSTENDNPGEIIMIYDDNRQLLVRPVVIRETDGPLVNLVLVPGFMVDYSCKTDPMTGNAVSIIELIPKDQHETVREFIKNAGLEGKVFFGKQKPI